MIADCLRRPAEAASPLLARLQNQWRRAHGKAWHALPLQRAAARLGAGYDAQRRLLPEDLAGLVPQVVVVPTRAIRWGGRAPRPYRWRGLIIEDGDWDLVCKAPIDAYLESDVYGRSIRQIFVERRRVDETDQYAAMRRRLAAGQTPKGCRSLKEIHAYFERLIAAHDAIRRDGYKTQAELGLPDPTDEIMVYVDRNGELHKQRGSGHHRLGIARLLGIPAVPVCIRGVHERWVRARHQQHGGDVLSALAPAIEELALGGRRRGGQTT